MSDTTKTELETIQEQIAVLKAQKELNQVKEQVVDQETPAPVKEQRRETRATSTGENFRQIKSSRVRAWGTVASHVFLPPVASAVYCSKTEKWAPFFIGTGMAVVGVPLAFVDMGITAGLLAPITSAVMIVNQVKDDRRRQGFIGPEEADVAYFSRSF